MSDYSSNDTREQTSNEASPFAASLLTFTFVLVLLTGGFAAWKFFAQREASKEAALTAHQRAAETEGRDQLRPYKVDPETGKLSPVDKADRVESNPNRPPDIGDFELIERSGRKITNKDLLGQPWAVCFVFTRCAGPCLNITGKMANLHRELGDAPVRLVTITVDPKNDTPEVLQNYADNFGADPDRWLFLTGEHEYVYRLLRGYFRQLVQELTGEQRQKGREVFHTDDILHIDAEGRIVKRYHGTRDSELILLRRALLAEAKQLAENPPRAEASESLPSPAVAEKPNTGSEGDE